MHLTERFLKYTTFDTQSCGASSTTPSTPGQRLLAKAIACELQEIGLSDIELDANGYLMATLPSNTPEARSVVGFIAHLDTSPELSGKGVKARVLTYQGGDIVLSKRKGIVLSPDVFPELNAYQGQEIVVTDGNTLLGADDKAGIAAIVSAMAWLMEHPQIRHGKARIAFTPDEEIGRGANHFDVARFGCDWAYTVDGGALGELEYENFNAAGAQVSFKGRNVHPGTAKDKMINAMRLAMRFGSSIPLDQRPEHTEGYEGFIHLAEMKGNVEEASLIYLIRDHDREKFELKKTLFELLAERLNEEYPGSVYLRIEDQYYNMREMIEPRMHIIELAQKAMQAVGLQPRIQPIRGGTDGARLSYMGLPCPNLFTGGHNFHGRYEFLPLQSLEKSMQTIIKIIELI